MPESDFAEIFVDDDNDTYAVNDVELALCPVEGRGAVGGQRDPSAAAPGAHGRDCVHGRARVVQRERLDSAVNARRPHHRRAAAR